MSCPKVWFQNRAPVPRWRPGRTAVSAVIAEDYRDPVGGHTVGERELVRAHLAFRELCAQCMARIGSDACHGGFRFVSLCGRRRIDVVFGSLANEVAPPRGHVATDSGKKGAMLQFVALHLG